MPRTPCLCRPIMLGTPNTRMGFLEYCLLALSSLFVVVDPVTLIPVFLAMTPRDSPADRTRMARTASIVAAGILLGFALFGVWVFRLLGISVTRSEERRVGKE